MMTILSDANDINFVAGVESGETRLTAQQNLVTALSKAPDGKGQCYNGTIALCCEVHTCSCKHTSCNRKVVGEEKNVHYVIPENTLPQCLRKA